MRCSASGSTQPSRTSSRWLSATNSSQVAARSSVRFADRDHMAQHADAELGQESLGQCADGDARSGFARAGAFQNIAGVMKVVFDRASQIGMSGPRARDRFLLDPRAPSMSSTGRASVQFFQSLFSIRIAMGEPMVCEWRTPLTMWARSVSIFMRPPRPKPCWRRHSSRSIAARRWVLPRAAR